MIGAYTLEGEYDVCRLTAGSTRKRLQNSVQQHGNLGLVDKGSTGSEEIGR